MVWFVNKNQQTQGPSQMMTPAFWIDLRFDERVKSKTVPTQQNDRVSSSQRGESRNEEELRQPAALKRQIGARQKSDPYLLFNPFLKLMKLKRIGKGKDISKIHSR